jgi:hypothetical protein
MERNDSIDFYDYEEDQVIYLYLTSIKNLNDNRLICKVGFATDLMQRHVQLMDSDYKAYFHIIGVKVCNRISDETRFHRLFKKHYNKLQYKCKIKSKSKDELYYYDTKLIKFWDKFDVSKPTCEKCVGNQMAHEIEKEIYLSSVEEKMFLMEQKNKHQQEEIESLKVKLEFERICNKLEHVIEKQRYMKLYDTTLRISRDFMKYVEDHPTNTNSDSDSECDDDDNYSVPFTMQEFCTEYDWRPEKAQEIKDVFRL